MTKRTPALTFERASEMLRYDPESGCLWWKNTGDRRRADRKAGHEVPGGYLLLRIDGVLHRGHRVAWLLQTQTWPSCFIDHIDGNKRNNRWANLRDVTQSVNMQNQRKAAVGSKSGLLGAHSRKNGRRFESTIGIGNGQAKWLGLYETAEEAHAAYLKAKRELHEGCTI